MKKEPHSNNQKESRQNARLSSSSSRMCEFAKNRNEKKSNKKESFIYKIVCALCGCIRETTSAFRDRSEKNCCLHSDLIDRSSRCFLLIFSIQAVPSLCSHISK